MATIFRDPLISTPRSPPRPGPTIAAAGLCCLLAIAGAKPFVQNDWPLPKVKPYPVDNRTWVQSYDWGNLGKDAFFSGPGKAPNYDWPLPKVKPYPIDNRSWIQSYDWGNLGKDTFFQGPGQAPTYDWPLPRIKPYPTDNRTWLQSYDWANLGKDTFFGAPGYAPDYDWPLPRTTPYPIHDRTFVAGRVIAPIYPFVQSDWPLPSTHQWDFRQGEVSGRSLGSGAMPFGQDDWPLPIAKQQGETWTSSPQIPSAAPFAQVDWPLPRTTSFKPADAAQSLVSLLPTGVAPFTPQDWPLPRKSPFFLGATSGRAISTALQAPFTQLDWPAPRTTKQAPQDWPQNSLVGLIPQSLAPFTPQDWPLPRKSPFVLGITSGRAIAPLVVQAPFTQLEWPNPKQAGLAAKTWTWSTLLPPQIQIALPFAQTDWPLTKKIYFVQGEISGRAIGTTVVTAPFSQLNWPLPGTLPSSIPAWYTLRYEPIPVAIAPGVVVTPVVVSSGMARRIFGPVDWSRFEQKKKQAKKKSRKAVELIEQLAKRSVDLSTALDILALQLQAARIKETKIYRDLLQLEMERKFYEGESDDEEVILLALR